MDEARWQPLCAGLALAGLAGLLCLLLIEPAPFPRRAPVAAPPVAAVPTTEPAVPPEATTDGAVDDVPVKAGVSEMTVDAPPDASVPLDAAAGLAWEGRILRWADGSAVAGSAIEVAASDAAPAMHLASSSDGSFSVPLPEAAPVLIRFLHGERLAAEFDSSQALPPEVVLDTGWLLTGTVRDTALAPLAGATVWLKADTLAGSASVRTDESGRYTLYDIPHGSAEVLVGARDGRHAARTHVLPGAPPGLWQVERDFVLEWGGSIEGRAWIAATGAEPARPAALARIDWATAPGPGAPENLRSQVSADDAGRFLIDGLPTGDVLLQARWSAADGSGPALISEPVRVAIAPGRTQAADLHLAPGASLEGRVVDAAGQPLSGWTVTVSATPSVPDAGAVGPGASTFPPAAESAITQDGGAFHFDALEVGSKRLQAFAPGTPAVASDASTQRDVELTRAGLAGVELVIVRLRAVRGLIVDERWRPVQGARALLMPYGDPAASTVPLAESDASGQLAFGLPAHVPGDLLLQAPGFLWQRIGLAEGDAALDLGTLRLADAPSFAGRLFDGSTYRPVADAAWRLSLSGGGLPITQQDGRTGPKGALAAYADREAGTWSLVVTSPGHAPFEASGDIAQQPLPPAFAVCLVPR